MARRARGIFVTGTDTGVGKTVVATALLRALVLCGARAAGMKPVAAGLLPGETVNADVRSILAAANVAAAPSLVNAYSFAPPIAPHLAARAAGTVIELERIERSYAELAAIADVVVVEGAGGALVPLTSAVRGGDMLDIARRIDVPVLLVVGVRLGCINHALLSALAIGARGLRFAGWVANRIDPDMLEGDANVATLRDHLPAPLISEFAWASDGKPSARFDRAQLSLLGLGQ